MPSSIWLTVIITTLVFLLVLYSFFIVHNNMGDAYVYGQGFDQPRYLDSDGILSYLLGSFHQLMML
jgi:hypothetical protein